MDVKALEMWDNGIRNIKQDWASLIDMSPLSRDSKFNMEACTV